MVPSSSTVTPLAATRSPMRPEKALEPLRLKSPSSPWPMASCSRMPGQPGPSTTVISPAGAGPRIEVGERRLDGLVDVFCDVRVVEVGQAEAAAAAAEPIFAPAVLLGDHGDRQPHQRPHVGRQRAVGARHQHHVVFARQAGHDLRHARVACERASFSTLSSSLTLAVLSSVEIGSTPL